uniref:Ig-like domain 2 protein n=1 Tax=Pseudomonas phage HRDY3 TaxID=3236930 RepID=A0AB39CEI2_9VIRU
MADTSFEELVPVQLDLIGPSAPIAERSTFQMRAVATFDDGSQHEVEAEWSLTSEQYGTITLRGLFTAGSVQTGSRPVQVHCRYYHEASQSTLTGLIVIYVRDVDTPPALVSIAIEGKTEVEKNTVESYVVHATYDNGSSKAVVPTTFVSSRPSVATIDATGIAHFQKIRGSAMVRFTASYTENGVTRQSVTDVLVVDSSIYPIKAFVIGPSIVLEKGRAQFGLDVLFDNGKNNEVIATWISTNPHAGTIGPTGAFIASAVEGVETTTIIGTYEYEGIVTSASIELSVVDLTVRPESLVIEGPAKVREGLVVQYYTTLIFSNGTRKAVHAKIHTLTSVGSMDDGNQFHAGPKVEMETPVNLMASYENLTAYKNIEVVPTNSPPVRSYIELRSPMYVGEYQSLKFHVVYEDGTDIVLPAKWELSNNHIANISSAGVLHAVQVMETAELTVYASTSISGVDLQSSLPVTIIDNRTYPTDARIEGPQTLRTGVPTQFNAMVKFSDGSERKASALWFCSDDNVLINLGIVTAKVPGTYLLQVSYALQHETVTATKEIIVT